MKQYVAFDVSKQFSEAVLVDETGAVVVRGKVRTDPVAMAGFVRTYGSSVALVGIESGPLSTWLFHALKALGLPIVCLDAWRAHAALSARLNKTDRTDAAGLADLMRAGFHRPVHVKSLASHERRALLKARDMIVAKRRDLQNQVRGLLENFGLVLAPGSGGRFAVLVDEALQRLPSLRPVIDPLMRVWHTARTTAAEMHRAIHSQASADADCRRLMTVPGVGPITALAFKSALDETARFADSRAVGAYFGLTPRRYQSGKQNHQGGISRAGDRFIRALLFEAAQVLLFRTKNKANGLQQWARRLAERIGRKKALVALARKLAVVMHTMLLKQADFQDIGATQAA